MHVVIVGCGRAGSHLASTLDSEGDTVALVDVDEHARDRLPGGFKGRFIRGDGMNRDVLRSAGIETADAFVAVSSNDSLNIVSARMARDVYQVPHVVGRLHDVDRAPVCAELGLAMVTSVRMTVNRIHRMLRHQRLEPEHSFGNGETVLVRSPVPDYLRGRPVADFNVHGEIQVVEVTSAGRSRIPTDGQLIRGGDTLSFIVASASLDRLRSFLGGRWH
ncbi:MAG TPA: TrkA family potassium uptake protein [Acidimicrobiales bacterium]|nr:TrkA family potassium uptake protein [Acidimicrobiales bacterium]